MKCLVLGGGGFMGSHLSAALIDHGHQVRIFERPNLRPVETFPTAAGVEWFEGDFVNPDDLASAVQGCELVFHLISTTLPKASNDNPVYDIESNLVGTLHLLDHARRAGVRKVVFTSSGGTIYGIPQSVPISETHPTEPICSYGIGKLAIEKYLHLYQSLHGLDYCVLRIANPYGEGQRPTAAQGAVAVFLHKAMHGEIIEIWGDGSVTRDYVYVGDVVRALLAAMPPKSGPRIINIGAGEGHSLLDLVGEIEALVGRPVARKHLAGRALDVPVNVLDISRARSVLEWAPEVGFRSGLARTYAWMLRDRSARGR